MGQERKRGKLMDFNALLRGDAGAFAPIVGDASQLASVRYVITLDTDTQLPRDAARQMIGAMSHILNRPVLRPEDGAASWPAMVSSSRASASACPVRRSSWFVRLFGGDAGLDPYTRVVSDVYQDLFAEGSFVGKGIYDVHVFETCCGAFPENAILSHDLLESAYVRSGLLSDVELFEDYPSRYPADVSRRHRWIRGDWQIAWWLFPWVPAGPDQGPTPSIPAALGAGLTHGAAPEFRPQPHCRAVVVEDLRQSPAQPGAGGTAAAVGRRLAYQRPRCGHQRNPLHAGRRWGCAPFERAGGIGAQTGGLAAPCASPKHDGRVGKTRRPVFLCARVFAIRSVHQR